MKNYYAILEVPVGCGVAEIRQAYRRLVQENLDNEAGFADLKEAHEVLTTPARRADYDRAVWGETFAPDSGDESVPGAADAPTLLSGSFLSGEPSSGEPSSGEPSSGGLLPMVLASPVGGAGRCPMGAEAQCPVLMARVGAADTYCPECGYLLAALRTADGFESAGAADEGIRLEEPSGRSHRLNTGLNLVGRESADVLLPDKTVSRQHARLEVGADGSITLEDLSSTNGTQVGGEMLVPHIPRTVQDGDRVRFGSVTTVLRLPAQEMNSAHAALGDSEMMNSAQAYSAGLGGAEYADLGPVRAQVVETREDGGRSYPLAPGVTTFGRRAENSVVLQGDPYVSGTHAQIIAEGDVFRLTDVGSTNGTLVNGQRLAINEPVTLTPGDLILIGGTAVRFEMLAPPEEAAEDLVPSDLVPSDFVPSDAAETEDAPAEPPERTALEYDVPDDEDVKDAGVKDENVTEQGDKPDSPTQVER